MGALSLEPLRGHCPANMVANEVDRLDEQLHTPIALIVFNRPSHTTRVFELIAKVRPRRLLVIADGPRPNKPGEDLLCDEAPRGPAVREGH